MPAMGVYDQIKKAFQDVVAPEIHELRGEIRRLDQKIDGVDQKLDQRFAILDQKIDGVDARLNIKLDSLEDRLSTRIGSLDNTITNMNHRPTPTTASLRHH